MPTPFETNDLVTIEGSDAPVRVESWTTLDGSEKQYKLQGQDGYVPESKLKLHFRNVDANDPQTSQAPIAQPKPTITAPAPTVAPNSRLAQTLQQAQLPPRQRIPDVMQQKMTSFLEVPAYEGKRKSVTAPDQQAQEPEMPVQTETRQSKVGSPSGQAMEYFMSQGWSREQAAGIVGNIIAESNFNPTVKGDGGLAYGIAQWHPDRQSVLFKKAKEWGANPAAFDTQLRFIQHELETSEASAAERLRNARSVEDSAAAFTAFERPRGWSPNGDPSRISAWNHRVGSALSVYNGKHYDVPSNAGKQSAINESVGGTAGVVNPSTGLPELMPPVDVNALAKAGGDGTRTYNDYLAEMTTRAQTEKIFADTYEKELSKAKDNGKDLSSADLSTLVEDIAQTTPIIGPGGELRIKRVADPDEVAKQKATQALEGRKIDVDAQPRAVTRRTVKDEKLIKQEDSKTNRTWEQRQGTMNAVGDALLSGGQPGGLLMKFAALNPATSAITQAGVSGANAAAFSVPQALDPEGYAAGMESIATGNEALDQGSQILGATAGSVATLKLPLAAGAKLLPNAPKALQTATGFALAKTPEAVTRAATGEWSPGTAAGAIAINAGMGAIQSKADDLIAPLMPAGAATFNRVATGFETQAPLGIVQEVADASNEGREITGNSLIQAAAFSGGFGAYQAAHARPVAPFVEPYVRKSTNDTEFKPFEETQAQATREPATEAPVTRPSVAPEMEGQAIADTMADYAGANTLVEQPSVPRQVIDVPSEPVADGSNATQRPTREDPSIYEKENVVRANHMPVEITKPAGEVISYETESGVPASFTKMHSVGEIKGFGQSIERPLKTLVGTETNTGRKLFVADRLDTDGSLIEHVVITRAGDEAAARDYMVDEFGPNAAFKITPSSQGALRDFINEGNFAAPFSEQLSDLNQITLRKFNQLPKEKADVRTEPVRSEPVVEQVQPEPVIDRAPEPGPIADATDAIANGDQRASGSSEPRAKSRLKLQRQAADGPVREVSQERMEPQAGNRHGDQENARGVEPVKRPSITTYALGHETEIVLPDNTSVPVRYALVSAKDLIPSHNPITLSKNERFPSYNENLYDTDPAQRAKVMNMVQNPKWQLMLNTTPSATDGPTVIDRTGAVAGGTGRFLATSEVMTRRPGEYEKVLADNAAMFGFDPAVVAQVDQPVVVRMRDHELGQDAESQRWISQLNGSLATGRGPVAEGVSLAKRLDRGQAGRLAETFRGRKFSEVLDTQEGRNSLTKIMREIGHVTDKNIEQFIKPDGKLTDHATETIEAMMLSNVLPDAKLLERLPPQWRTRMVESLGPLSTAQAVKGWELTDNLTRLVEYNEALQAFKRRGGKAADFAQQITFEGNAHQLDKHDQFIYDLLEAKGRSKGFERFMEHYGLEALSDQRGEVDMLRGRADRRSTFDALIQDETRRAVMPLGNVAPGSTMGMPLRPTAENMKSAVDRGTITAEQAKNVLNREQMITRLGDAVGIKVQFKGVQGKLRAQFNKQTGDLRVANREDLGAAAHEVGHHVEPMLFPKGIDRYEGELAALGRALYGESRPAHGYESEGIAEFVRLYIEDPQAAKTKAQQFYDHFENTLRESEPDILQGLLEARNQLELYNKADAWTRVATGMNVDTPRKGTVKERLNETVDAIVFSQFDNLAPVGRVEAKLSGKKFDTGAIMQKFEQIAGADGMAAHFIETGEFNGKQYDSFKKIVGEFVEKGEREKFQVFLRAWLAQDYFNAGKQPGMSLTKSDADEILRTADPRFRQAAEKISNNILRAMWDAARDSEVISKEVWGAAVAANKHYVPNYKQQRTVRGAMLKSRKGGEGAVLKPLENSLNHIFDMTRLVKRREAQKAFFDMIEENEGSSEIATKIAEENEAESLLRKLGSDGIKQRLIDHGYTEKDIADIVSKVKTGTEGEDVLLAKTLADTYWDPRTEVDGNIIRLRRKGKMEVWQVHDRRLFEAVSGDPHFANFKSVMSLPGIGTVVKAQRDTIRKGITETAPFILANGIKDSIVSFLRTEGKFALPFQRTIEGFVHMASKDPMKSRIYSDFGQSGVKMGDMSVYDARSATKAIKEMNPSYEGTLLFVPRHPFMAMRRAGQALEAATRLGEYQHIYKRDLDANMKSGMSETEARTAAMSSAAQAARRITQDFTKMGWMTRLVNQVTPFYGANVGDSYQTWQYVKKHPMRYLTRGTLGITMPTFALWYLQKDDPIYQSIPQEEKDRNWIVIIGGEQYRIPKPYLAGTIFASIPERIWSGMYENDTERMQPGAILGALGRSVEPPFLPGAAKLWFEWNSNHQFYNDQPIEPKYSERLPTSERATSNTGEAAHWISRGLDKVGLADPLGASPAKIEYGARTIFGYAGTQALRVADQLAGAVVDVAGADRLAAKKTTLPMAQPLFNRFYRNDPGTNGEFINRFYEKKDDIDKQFESEKARDGAPSKETDKQRKAMDHVGQQLRDLRLLREAVQNDPTMSTDDKTDRLNEIFLEMNAISRKALGLKGDLVKVDPQDVAPLKGRNAEARKKAATTRESQRSKRVMKEPDFNLR